MFCSDDIKILTFRLLKINPQSKDGLILKVRLNHNKFLGSSLIPYTALYVECRISH